VSVSQDEPAVASDKPVMPKKSIFLAGGLLIGLLAAAGVVVFAVISNNVIVTEAGAERVLNLPVLMTVPRLAIAAQPRRPAIT
jgi:tyrosine-protein kinase Etk/Wzc